MHQKRNTAPRGALYIAWKLRAGEKHGAHRRVWGQISKGEQRHLFRVVSCVVAGGEVRALMMPEAPLEAITGAILRAGDTPAESRWVAGRHACAALAREIEATPVVMGLALRPEQWPLSSAASD